MQRLLQPFFLEKNKHPVQKVCVEGGSARACVRVLEKRGKDKAQARTMLQQYVYESFRRGTSASFLQCLLLLHHELHAQLQLLISLLR